MRYSPTTAVSVLACLSSALATPVHKRQSNGSMVYDFKDLTSTKDLQWTPCYDQFTCALIEVPLDYEDDSAGTTDIAFIKWATNSTTNSSAAHDIVVNPGGPGGSGVSFLLGALDLLLTTLGSQNNIVSFDPRGVNNSGPDLSCFPGQPNTATLYDPQLGRSLDANDSKSLHQTYARAGAFGEWCSQVHSAPNSTAKYANTIATATDMLHYTELLASSKGQNPDESQLWYYGASYGTVLGSTFASLFPDRVGRVILDGVVDGEDYYQGKWEANLPDADKAVSSFFKYCYEAGSNGTCTFWDETPEAIEARFHAVVDDLTENPIILTNPNAVMFPAIITITDFKDILTQMPYSPSDYFPILARILLELEERNGTTLALLTGAGARNDDCDNPVDLGADLEPRQFIACTDGNGRFNVSTFDKFVDHVDLLVDQSRYLGESWAAGTSVNCYKLDIKAPKSQVMEGYPQADKTSNPLLFIGNTADPVTPHRAAEKMSKRFGGAGLLTQDSVGHCSVAAYSSCTVNYIQQYIKDASLPDAGTVCEAEQVPFQNNDIPTSGANLKILKKRHHV